jgi:hypothetical protein
MRLTNGKLNSGTALDVNQRRDQSRDRGGTSQ